MKALSVTFVALMFVAGGAAAHGTSTTDGLTAIKTVGFLGHSAHLYGYKDSGTGQTFAWSLSREHDAGYLLGWWGSTSDAASEQAVNEGLIFMVARTPGTGKVRARLSVQAVVYVDFARRPSGAFCASKTHYVYKAGHFVGSDAKLKSVVTELTFNALDIAGDLEGPDGKRVKFTDPAPLLHFSYCQGAKPSGAPAQGNGRHRAGTSNQQRRYND